MRGPPRSRSRRAVPPRSSPKGPLRPRRGSTPIATPTRRATTASRPGPRRPPDRLRRVGGKETPAQRLHRDHPDAPGGGEPQPGESRLEVNVEQVELDLADLPVVPLEHLGERVGRTVEGEPRVGDAPVASGAVEGAKAPKALHGFPAFAV